MTAEPAMNRDAHLDLTYRAANGLTVHVRATRERSGWRVAMTMSDDASTPVGSFLLPTKATLGSNCAHVTVRRDPRTGWVVAIAAIDNLTKGASGAAVQCANLLLDLPETAGLPTVGVYP